MTTFGIVRVEEEAAAFRLGINARISRNDPSVLICSVFVKVGTSMTSIVSAAPGSSSFSVTDGTRPRTAALWINMSMGWEPRAEEKSATDSGEEVSTVWRVMLSPRTSSEKVMSRA